MTYYELIERNKDSLVRMYLDLLEDMNIAVTIMRNNLDPFDMTDGDEQQSNALINKYYDEK